MILFNKNIPIRKLGPRFTHEIINTILLRNILFLNEGKKSENFIYYLFYYIVIFYY